MFPLTSEGASGIRGREGVLATSVGLALAVLPLAALVLLRPWIEFRFAREVYLPLHTAIELLVTSVAFAAFVVQWFAASAGVYREARARFVGAGFLAVAVLEAMHLFAFPGMPTFLGASTTERGIYYWLASRTWTVVTLLGALAIDPNTPSRLFRRGPLLLWNLGAVAVLVAIDAALPADRAWFYVEGAGLTPLKRFLEGGTGVLAAAGAWIYARRAARSRREPEARIATALGLAALAAAALMLYQHAYDPFNVLGHVYLVVSTWSLLQALFIASVAEPHAALERSNAELERLRGHVEGELAQTIAQLRLATHKEAAARAQLAAAVEAVPGALLWFARDGSIASANAAAAKLLGSAGEPGRPNAAGLQILAPALPDGALVAPEASPVARALRGETIEGKVLRLTPPGGAPVWVAASAAPVRVPDGGPGAVLVLADVTELVGLQEQREDLLRAVSHDLRNPLQIVLLQAQRLSSLAEEGTKHRRAADAIVGAGRRMEGMIRDLVESARLEGGSLVLRPEPVQLRRFVGDLFAQSVGVLDTARVRNAIPEDLPDVEADPARLDRILMNLVSNALAYTSEGAVEVRAEHDGELVRVAVVDRGPGIPADELPFLFEKFRRGRGRGHDGGLGLGLFIVRKLIEAHGGSIHAESIPGRGSRFEFTLRARG